MIAVATKRLYIIDGGDNKNTPPRHKTLDVPMPSPYLVMTIVPSTDTPAASSASKSSGRP